MSWRQAVQPRLGTTDFAGWCLRFAQSVFNAPVAHRSAWIAWQNAPGRHNDRNFPTDVSVIVWFEHWGNYGFWDNWGHVAVWVPGRGYLSSPVTWNGKGSQWFQNIEQLERALPGKYVGWSEGINGLRVIERVETDPVGGIMSYYKDKRAFRADVLAMVKHAVPRAKFNAGHKDSRGRAVVENLASQMRRVQMLGRQNRTKLGRVEGKVDALGKAIAQLSGGKIDMAVLEKAAYEGAAKGAADVEAREVAELLELSVRQAEVDAAEDAAFLDEEQ